jgi:hypothetical protein
MEGVDEGCACVEGDEAVYDIHRLGKVKLAKGGHKEINADGEVCVNEAAILAAGFEHRKVRQANDCPSCFSRVIAQYAIILNDRMPNNLRNELLTPFILRLAGTADRPAVELARLTFIVLQSMRKINSYFLCQTMDYADLARQCERVHTIPEAWFLAKRIIRRLPSNFLLRHSNSTAFVQYPGDGPAGRSLELTYMTGPPVQDTLTSDTAATLASDTAAMHEIHTVICRVAYVRAYMTGRPGQRDLFTMATDILDKAISMGNHPAPDGEDPLLIKTILQKRSEERRGHDSGTALGQMDA